MRRAAVATRRWYRRTRISNFSTLPARTSWTSSRSVCSAAIEGLFGPTRYYRRASRPVPVLMVQVEQDELGLGHLVHDVARALPADPRIPHSTIRHAVHPRGRGVVHHQPSHVEIL